MTSGQGWTRRGVLGAAGASVAAGPGIAAPSGDLRGDVAILRDACGALHPGLHRYATPSQVEDGLARLERALVDGRALADRFLALNRFTSLVKCGHTQPNPFNQSRAVTEAILQPRRLPFTFQWLAGEMVVTWAEAATSLPRGARILEVDGRRAPDILRRLLPLARADGNNTGKRIAQMGVRGAGRFEAFDIGYALLFGEPGERVRLRVVLPGETTARRIEVAGLAGTGTRLPVPDARSAAPLWTVDRLPEGVIRLTMPSWGVFNSKWDWSSFLAGVLDEAAEARVLIVDIRGNEGGADCGDAILRRLVRQDTRPEPYRRKTRYRSTPPALDPYLETWNRRFRDWGEEATGPDQDGFYTLREAADGGVIRPEGRPVRARVHVLVDETCSSATFQFARIVRDTGVATLAGTTTGGNLRGINSGGIFFLRLPASGLEVDLPLIGGFPDRPRPDAGVAPDLRVETTARDIVAGRDPVLERVLGLAARG